MSRLPHRIRIEYALPAFALAAIGIPLYVYLPKFYSDVVGVRVGFVGAVLLLVRISDAFTDPIFGHYSDRTHSRWGRRRPWMVLGSIPLALTFYLLMHPPHLGIGPADWWFAIGVFLVFLFWTAVAIPYESLGAELSLDYDERTSLLSLREGFVLLGTLAAAAAPATLAMIFDLPDDDMGERAKFSWMGSIYAVLLLALIGWCSLRVRERYAQRPAQSFHLVASLKEASANRPFRILLIAYTVAAFGSSLPATMLLYYVQYVLESRHGELYLLLYLASAVLCLPLWILIAHRVGKKAAWLGAMAWTVASFLPAMLLGRGDEAAFTVIAVLTGAGGGAILGLPYAMQADVIDVDELNTGERREGRYIGLWAVAKKLSAALGVGAALALLDALGYVPNASQSVTVKNALRMLYILLPCLCFVAAFIVGLRYPLGRQEHEAVRAKLAARAQEAA